MNDQAISPEPSDNRCNGQNRTTLWHFHRLSGVIIIFLLAFHVSFVMAEKGSTIGSIQQRAMQLGYVAADIMLLIIALFHGLNGLRMILNGILEALWKNKHQEWSQERLKQLKLFMTLFLIIMGVLLTIYGVAFIMLLSFSPTT